jgi:hypothetical protein
LVCPGCGKALNPEAHGELVCDGEVWCDGCHRYARLLLEPRSFFELEEWNRKICRAFGFAPPVILPGELPPPGPFDFLEKKKLLLAEADHRQRAIILYPPGQRLATLCHELAHIMTGQEHTATWARTFARLVAWVKAQLPEDHFTGGFKVNLL